MTTVDAIYEHGVIKLKKPVALLDGTHVRVTIPEEQPAETQSSRRKTAAQMIAEIAALPMEPGPEFHGEDHDEVLYGWKKR